MVESSRSRREEGASIKEGSGARCRRYSTRPSDGSTDLAAIVELSGDYTVSRHWSVNAFLGVARGGEVVCCTFVGRTMTFGYLENVPQF